MSQPSVIEEYFRGQAEKLRSDFDRIRKTRKDTDVKGGDNEETVKQFLESHVVAAFYTSGVEIIDAAANHSDEVDICACNADQPFGVAPGQLVIAEGVDYVVQVKAVLTPEEIRRSVKNCATVKTLVRRHSPKDALFATNINDVPYFVDRIPYIVFAFTSSALLDTTHKNVIEITNTVPLNLQPDAFFILDKGSIVNFHEGKGKTWTSGGKPMVGYCAAHSGDQTVLEFVRFLTEYVPRIRRFSSPLAHYFVAKPTYRFVGRVLDTGDGT